MKQQPVLFIGHGSPMNALALNEWTEAIRNLGKTLVRPEAIVMVSAHWLTRGTKIHASPHPKTIHDFRGFPPELYKEQYPAPGDLDWARKVQSLLPGAEITEDWGFDHGNWGVLKFLRPEADVPVIPISLSADFKSIDFYEMGQNLSSLRSQNVLIVASGNLVHNLHEINFREERLAFDWAQDFDLKIENYVEANQIDNLLGWPLGNTQEFMRAHPTSEHWAPFLVCLGAAGKISDVKWIYKEIQNGSISMRSAQWG